VKKDDHRHMIFEAALIACLGRHPSNGSLLTEDTMIFRNKYASSYDFSKASFAELELFWKYYVTIRIAAPLLRQRENQGHSLKLIPRLVEAKNVEYQVGGKSSLAVKFRVRIYEEEIKCLKNSLVLGSENSRRSQSSIVLSSYSSELPDIGTLYKPFYKIGDEKIQNDTDSLINHFGNDQEEKIDNKILQNYYLSTLEIIILRPIPVQLIVLHQIGLYLVNFSRICVAFI